MTITATRATARDLGPARKAYAARLEEATGFTIRWGYWFEGRVSRHYLPGPCVEDCTRPGPADDAVEHWIKELRFDAPPWVLRKWLKDFRCFEPWELCDHKANLGRLLWIWAYECKDAGGSVHMYLGQ